MMAYNAVAFGCELRAHRLKLGWSAIQLSELYAEFVGREDSPPNPAFIYHIERGTTMVSLERRTILASLVGMPLALVGIAQPDSATRIDILEYTQALESYCNKWRDGTLMQEVSEIKVITNQLGTNAFQSFGAEKRALLELFCFYQLLYADPWTGGHQPAIAYSILSSTIEIAKEEKFSALYVYALTQRAGLVIAPFKVTGNSKVLEVAAKDYHDAVQEQGNLAAFYVGLLHIRKGCLDAYAARDKKEFTAALRLITKGSNHIGASSDDRRIIARLDEERCMLTRASAYLYAPMGDAKLGLAVLQELELEHPDAHGKSRLVHRNELFAQAYLATGDYPMAAAHLEAAVDNTSSSDDWIDNLAYLHAQLKNTSYGNDPDVGRLAVKIHQIKYPELFL